MRSLAHKHFKGRRACWSFGTGLGRSISNSITHTDLHKPNTSWLVRSWSPLVHERTTNKHRFTRLTTARTWKKPPPSPLRYSLCLATRPAPKCRFVLELPNGSLEIPLTRTLAILGAYNFVCRPLIEIRSKVKL